MPVFSDLFTKELTADTESENFIRQVSAANFSYCHPVQPKAPKLLSYSKEVADLLQINTSNSLSAEWQAILAGAKLAENSIPFAMRYAGHQFGNWAGQLGDGRAINLGNLVVNNQPLELQLKGAGPTPYSRAGDGFAVLRSSVREYLCSEAMHHLGIPTTRALSLMASGDSVTRDMFYDGHPEKEIGAIVCRVAPSFIRFGNFQIHAAYQELDLLKQLADFTIRNYFSHLIPQSGSITKETYITWFSAICHNTADMIVHWQRVGFVHGVMNTDNMSIHGLTIDYGPYGFLDNFDPDWTPNTTDAQGKRYRYANQPYIAHWNLVKLAEAIYPLIEDTKPLEDILNQFPQYYEDQWQNMMAHKLGLDTVSEQDSSLFKDLEKLLAMAETDMTIFYRELAKFDGQLDSVNSLTESAYYNPQSLSNDYLKARNQWFFAYSARLQQNSITEAEKIALMNRTNPKYLLRNFLSQVAIDKADAGDCSEIEILLEIMRNPYAEQPQYQDYYQKRPEWARHKAGCSMLSCSS
ncbi:YdiU family protein [Kangiella sp. HZ709]|uniref:protein adenylyltransferase SelO n=1 Tax=Kangiella sp. HZ709 TaxID=2666328 RepID=UPI0012B03F94|nr:YdiU family protein [Kangiella sp. HZ709]MRX28049.1 YdiU family protein [Kangiella sp. HZ709]